MSSNTCMLLTSGLNHEFKTKTITHNHKQHNINICTTCGYSNNKINSDDHTHIWSVYVGKCNECFILKCAHIMCKQRIYYNPNIQKDIIKNHMHNSKSLETILE